MRAHLLAVPHQVDDDLALHVRLLVPAVVAAARVLAGGAACKQVHSVRKICHKTPKNIYRTAAGTCTAPRRVPGAAPRVRRAAPRRG